MRTVTRSSLLVVVGLLLIGPQSLHAQRLFFVTGLSEKGAAAFETIDGTQWELSAGGYLEPGTVRVSDGAQLMLLEEHGAVVIVLGPAVIVASHDEIRDEVRLELRDGRLMFVSTRDAGEGRQIVVSALVSEHPLELLVGPGQTFMERDGDRVSVAYVAGEIPISISIRVSDASVSLSSGQLLTWDGAAAPEIGPLDEWVTQQGFDRAWGRELGVASAQVSRVDVETNLFNNIIAWDRYAGAKYVVPRLPPSRFKPEIRTIVETVTTPSRPSTRATSVQTQPFPAANEVPLMSPAAASVQNVFGIGQGVTAVELNRSAAALLQATGSRGLGFRGLRQLAIPGFSGGVRTTGPAGLGAQP